MVHTFPKGICPKVDVLARLEFELAFYDSAVLRINHNTTGTPPDMWLVNSSVGTWKIDFKNMIGDKLEYDIEIKSQTQERGFGFWITGVHFEVLTVGSGLAVVNLFLKFVFIHLFH